jgi:hypothetical protein
MTSLLSSIARSFSGEVSRSYSGRSNTIQSVPSLNDFNSLTFIECENHQRQHRSTNLRSLLPACVRLTQGVVAV